MLTILFALFIGWLFSLVGVDTLLHNVVGLSHQGYYIVWFVMGCLVWLKNWAKS